PAHKQWRRLPVVCGALAVSRRTRTATVKKINEDSRLRAMEDPSSLGRGCDTSDAVNFVPRDCRFWTTVSACVAQYLRDFELQLTPGTSLEQLEAIRSGRLAAGFVFNMPEADAEFDHIPVALQPVELAVPKRHTLAKVKKLRLRDLVDAPFVWFPRRESPAF